MRARSLIVVFCLALAAGAVPAAANLLTNGDFETGPYYSQTVPGWNWWAVNASNLFDGVFDSSWNVPPPCNPSDPSNYGPHGGTYYLARYYKPGGCEVPGGGKSGALYQQVSGLTPGTTYYAQAWFATHHPHGGGAGFRIGVDPDPGPNPSPSIVWMPPVDVVWGDRYAYSEAAYKKLEAAAAAGASGSVAVWLQYTTTSNNVSEPQIVQVDDVRLANTHSMEISNIDVIGQTTTIAQVTFDTFDGGLPLATNGFVDYGLTSSYGLTKADPSNPRANHEITLTGLSAGATYNYMIRATAAGYENAATANLTFVMQPSLWIANVVATPQDGGTTCVVTWTTQKSSTDTTPVLSDSRVDYGLTSSYGQSTYDATLVSNHSVTLTGLYPSTRYFYRVASVGPGYNARRYPAPPTTVTFVTRPGATLFNGGFEVTVPNRNPNSEIPGWQRGMGWAGWYPSGEWSIPAQSGSLYTGSIANYGLNNCSLHQQIQTTPGQELSYSAYIWAQAYGQGPGCAGAPHRFGETSGLIGIDPTGGTDPYSGNIVWSAERQTQDWHNFSLGSGCASTANWQKVGVAAVAQGNTATVFLKTHIWYPIAWNMVCWDNVSAEPITPVASVAQARQLSNDTVINLVGTEPLGSPIVTYVSSWSDMNDNNGAGYFYVEDKDRVAGIKVTMAPGAQWPNWIEVGKRVNIKGSITWGRMRNRTLQGVVFDQQLRLNKPTGERVISAYAVTNTGQTATVDPIGMGNQSIAAGSSIDHWFTNPGAVDIGGAGTVPALGVNTVGLLVKTWGKIIGAGMDGNANYYIVIDDGSRVAGYSEEYYPPVAGRRGLYVLTGPDYDYSIYYGRYAIVTGISAVRTDYDFEDPSYQLTPEAMKNVRFVKPRLKAGGEPDIDILPT